MRGDIAEAVKVWESNKGETVADFFRVIGLADLPDGKARANQLYREISARDLSEWDQFNSQLMLRFLGNKDQAVAVSRRFLREPSRFPPVRQGPFERALEYCAGQRTADDLIASMHGNRGDLSNAYVCIALNALADGDRATARNNLELCVRARHFEFLPYDLALMWLSRMDADAQWPQWIK